jgi:hypothetical protein
MVGCIISVGSVRQGETIIERPATTDPLRACPFAFETVAGRVALSMVTLPLTSGAGGRSPSPGQPSSVF